MKSVAIEARMRMTGLDARMVDGAPETGKPNVGTVHGTLCLQGALDHSQWQAAEWYLHRRNEYLQAVKAPGAQWQPKEDHGDRDPESYARWCEAARKVWLDIGACLQEASIQARSPIQAAFNVVLERQIADMHHMVGDLRAGLNMLSRVFLSSRRQAA